ncbi:hypothetical protein Zm00014a_028983 [Zea mays]|uniref:Bifunctional inhibitor/plant lipid transfer protein/seed storage helical domain-containing protein n=2 Tax=Zea mays TaxID=4577 RepID=B6UIG0_MAIZE|nr:uncharacterized protein LOC100279160 precursor [Zea mays]ACG49143.1 hypothetical protein [Zea mays]AQK41694.1 hypothetical protein ZEAMMB73_Zm00001d024659 [Zea mays]PWZ44379.1 hypothetical protein Zm00014a_028983 [Zea mays]|eukprot:NP_001145663.1 uncharacterized protein LOC100279160 precursor [Zea mays]
MLPAKVSFVFLIVYCAVTFSLGQIAVGEACTVDQRDKITTDCREFIKLKGPVTAPSYTDDCCVAIRAVPNLDMECIIRLLSNKQKKKYDVDKIRRLGSVLCNPHPVMT